MPMPSLPWLLTRSRLARYGRSPCPTRRNPRSGSIEHALCRCWGPPGCHCRWRAAHPRQPRCPQRISRRRTPGSVPKSLSMRRKSLTSVWRRSMSSIRKMPEQPSPSYNLPEKAGAATPAEAAEAATEAAEAATGAAGVAAVEAVEAVEAAGGGGSSLADGVTEAADFTWWQSQSSLTQPDAQAL
jgi:hypothetical protein